MKKFPSFVFVFISFTLPLFAGTFAKPDIPVEKADVLKVAHHGGNTSTCEAFLKAVDPQYAVISVGKGNKHGHPHPESLSKLEKRKVTIFRTDLFGTVIGTSDGESWSFEVMKAR